MKKLLLLLLLTSCSKPDKVCECIRTTYHSQLGTKISEELRPDEDCENWIHWSPYNVPTCVDSECQELERFNFRCE